VVKILDKKQLAPTVCEFTVEAPLIAHKCKPGQFVMVLADENSERIPLTIGDSDATKGTITMVIQQVGNTTRHICNDFNVGESFQDILGPLGCPSEMGKFGTVVMVCGGIGVAPVHPIAEAYHKLGNKVITIIGGRNKDLILWRDKMAKISDELIITTDDGSEGIHGFVTQPIQEMMEKGQKPDLVVAIGPVPMMMNVAKTTKPFGVRTTASLSCIMVDGTGMCGGCRVRVNGENKFTCCDGPEFDAHQVDWANLIQRGKMYKGMEAEEYSCGGHCKCVEE